MKQLKMHILSDNCIEQYSVNSLFIVIWQYETLFVGLTH